jgi:putative two-component system response regulator
MLPANPNLFLPVENPSTMSALLTPAAPAFAAPFPGAAGLWTHGGIAGLDGLGDEEGALLAGFVHAARTQDDATARHILRVAQVSRLLARELTGDHGYAGAVFYAAALHDVGKLGIPREILCKPGKLDMHEFEQMKRHTVVGWAMLREETSPLLRLSAQVALSHHEKLDGSGYPQQLSGSEIPFAARVVAVADVFDALTSPRIYKRAWTLDETLAYLRDLRGRHFDPDCVDALIRYRDAVDVAQHYTEDEDEPVAL